MADIYCNIDNVSGIEDGTSEATGYTDLRDAWSGATLGDRIFIAAGSTAYSLYGSNVYTDTSHLDMTTTTLNKNSVEIIGYNGNTYDVPMGDDRPLIYSHRTNGTALYVPDGGSIANVRVYGRRYNANNNGSALIAGNTCRVVNCKFTGGGEDYLIGDRVNICSFNGGAELIDCEIVETISSTYWPTRDQYYENFFTLYESSARNCVFRVDTDAPILAFNRRRIAYGNPSRYTNCIFIGNGYQTADTPAGTSHTQSYNGCDFRGCIFYNMDNAIKIEVPISTTAAQNTETEWMNGQGRNDINFCIFINCGRGVFQDTYTTPSNWESGTFTMEHVTRLTKCAFYNCTTANTDGDMRNVGPLQLTADPFVDSANGNFALNDVEGGGAELKKYDTAFDITSGFKARHYAGGGLFEAPSDISGATANFDASLPLNSTITFGGSGKTFRLASKTGIPVWRRS